MSGETIKKNILIAGPKVEDITSTVEVNSNITLLSLKEFEKQGESFLSNKYRFFSLRLLFTDLNEAQWDKIVITQLDDDHNKSEFFTSLVKILKPNADLQIFNIPNDSAASLDFTLKISGFVNITKKDLPENSVKITCSRPSYEVGSSRKLTLKSPVENVWKLDDTVDDDIIDEDELLDEEDLKKPDPSSLRGTKAYLFRFPSLFLIFDQCAEQQGNAKLAKTARAAWPRNWNKKQTANKSRTRFRSRHVEAYVQTCK